MHDRAVLENHAPASRARTEGTDQPSACVSIRQAKSGEPLVNAALLSPRSANRASAGGVAAGFVLEQRHDGVRPVRDVIERLLITYRPEAGYQDVQLLPAERPSGARAGGLRSADVGLRSSESRRARSSTSRSRHRSSARSSADSRTRSHLERPRRRREALRARSRFRTRAERGVARPDRRVAALPDRPLSREDVRRGHPLPPLREHDPRARVEPAVRLVGADHDGPSTSTWRTAAASTTPWERCETSCRTISCRC